MLDDGCTVEGYQSDITRTFVFGKSSDKMKQVFEIVHRAQTAALKTARPGVECQAVDAAARKVITDAGYGPDYKFFTHRVGHGIGMDGHEWPYLVRGNTTPLARGMTFSDEPGIYIPGEFGVRLEDDMHITENGAELFTPQSPSLEDPFGTRKSSKLCHPERSSVHSLANGQTESKDPYELKFTRDRGDFAREHARTPAPPDFDSAIGVLRLRDCFAKRSSHSAQDDKRR